MALSDDARLRVLEKLRGVVRDCLGKHLYASAVFFADKLVTIGGRESTDVYLLAQAYFLSRQFRQALHLLRKDNLMNESVIFRYLAAKCLVQSRCGYLSTSAIQIVDFDCFIFLFVQNLQSTYSCADSRGLVFLAMLTEHACMNGRRAWDAASLCYWVLRVVL